MYSYFFYHIDKIRFLMIKKKALAMIKTDLNSNKKSCLTSDWDLTHRSVIGSGLFDVTLAHRILNSDVASLEQTVVELFVGELGIDLRVEVNESIVVVLDHAEIAIDFSILGEQFNQFVQGGV
ncbi:hypothetical protein BpHYR1_003061 [Brachionus plicatilis]|uniref:Uncharacterized protein n=1 Tax=Brachionus plicatilis TaxID=10195 RepID=A0A3M7SER2_BRAPC|nr:hypothetical protein BpHYR1_003061 [Brachionus plicatilis]